MIRTTIRTIPVGVLVMAIMAGALGPTSSVAAEPGIDALRPVATLLGATATPATGSGRDILGEIVIGKASSNACFAGGCC